MNIIFFGTPQFVLPVLDTLRENFNVVGIVTAPDAPVGRKKIITPSPVKAYAEQNNISTIITPQQFNNPPAGEAGAAIQQLSDLHPDLFVVAAYGKIIPQAVLNISKFGALNIHPSLLPKYRGPSPIQSAILAGETETGITIIKMDEKMDHGPILAQETIPLSPKDTFEKLHVSMFQKAADMLPDVINTFVAGEIEPFEQDHTQATYCKMITKQDGYFDIENPPSPDVLERMMRAYYPWPTAWTKLRIMNNELKIMKLLPENRIQLEGGKAMPLKDFINGYPELKQTLQYLILNTKY